MPIRQWLAISVQFSSWHTQFTTSHHRIPWCF